MTKSVIMIHGAFAGPWCWDDYKAFFLKHGWTCHTPALRYHGGDPKADPDPDLANTSIADYANDIAAFVQTLDAKPILLGHAVGGMIAQQVASRGLASAVVAINPNAPWGMLPETDDERAVARTFMEMGPFWKRPLRVPFDLIAPFALNKLDIASQHAVFDRLGPESGRVMFEMFFWMFDDNRAAAVAFDKVSCPVLVVSGEDDRPSAMPSARRSRANMAQTVPFTWPADMRTSSSWNPAGRAPRRCARNGCRESPVPQEQTWRNARPSVPPCPLLALSKHRSPRVHVRFEV
jgi:non-heme chloroperoxidase